jgi:hypothetical protein
MLLVSFRLFVCKAKIQDSRIARKWQKVTEGGHDRLLIISYPPLMMFMLGSVKSFHLRSVIVQ